MIGALYKNINKTNKLAGYKITFKKITIFLYINNEQSQIEKKNTTYNNIYLIPRYKFDKKGPKFINWKLQNLNERNSRPERMKKYNVSWIQKLVLSRWQLSHVDQ